MNNRRIHWYDYLTVNSYWFAIAIRSQVMTPLLIPLLVQQFVGEEAKGTYYGDLRLGGLMTALLFQTIMGMLSDRHKGRWGRRRVFIVGGTLGEISALVGIGALLGGHGMQSYWLLFGIYLISMMFSNTAQAGVNGFIPDVVPDVYKSKFSMLKSLFDLPLSLIFFSLVLSKVVSSGNIPAALIILAAINLVCMLLSLFVPEEQIKTAPKMELQPVFRMVGMVLVFILIVFTTGWIVDRFSFWILPLQDELARSTLIAITATGMISLAILVCVFASLSISLGAQGSRDQSYRRWLINRLAFLTGTNNLAGFMVYFLQSKFSHLQGVQAVAPVSGLITVTGACILLSILPSGWLCDRFGKKHIIVVSAFLVAAGAVVMVNVNKLELVAIGAGMIGCGAGLFYTASWALGTTIVPKEQAGLYLGLSNIAGAGAGAIGAYIGGPIGDKFGYSVLMIIFGLVVFISSFTFLNVNPLSVFMRSGMRLKNADENAVEN
jgi:MFS family permease